MLTMRVVCHHGMSFEDFPSQVYGIFMLTWQLLQPFPLKACNLITIGRYILLKNLIG